MEAGIKFCLVGGLAVDMLANPRATEDIDLLVLLDEQELDRLADLFGTCMRIVNKPALMRFANATKQRFVVQAPGGPDGGLVIVVVLVADNAVYRNALKDIFTIFIDGVPIPVPSREGLIAIKKLSNRPQDISDIAALQEEREA